MKTGLVITTINKANKNIQNIDEKCRIHKWDFCIVGDKKTPKKFKIKYGNYANTKFQKKLKFKFSKICPFNSYSRKNIGYLILAQNRNDFIVETDDDNYPKNNFFKIRSISHKTKKVLNTSWVNIYKPFLSSDKHFIWPRGLPLDEINRNHIKLSKKKNIKVTFSFSKVFVI